MYALDPKRFRGARTCSRSSITMSRFGGAWTLHESEGTKNVEFFVCLSVTLMNDKVCENDFAQKALELRSAFDIVG